MKKLFASFGLLALFFSFAPTASADVMRNARGSVVLNKGTVYFVGTDTLYPFPSMEVFRSYGHVPSDIKPANAADMVLKVGPVATLNHRPFGHVDEVTADGYIRGWAVDRDHLIDMEGFTIWAFYDEPHRADGNYKYSASAAGVMGNARPDVNAALGITGEYGFELSVIPEVVDGTEHMAYVYAVDQESLDKPVLLTGAPIKFTLSTTPYVHPALELSLHSPNGGEYWELGSIETIYWSDSDNASNNTYGVYLVDNESTYHQIATGVTGLYYDWAVGTISSEFDPVSIGVSYKIQVINEQTGTYDNSDHEFTIYENYQQSSSWPTGDEGEDLTNLLIISQIFGELHAYHSDHGVFPSSLDFIESFDETILSPGSVGVCSVNDSQIVYTPTNNYSNFSIKFCIGTDYFYNQIQSVPEAAPYIQYFTKGVKNWDWQLYKELLNT